MGGALIPKDKAIKRNEVSNPVPARLMPTLIAAGARIIYGPSGPKITRKVYYCISAALHSNKVHRACDAYRHARENLRLIVIKQRKKREKREKSILKHFT